MAFVRSPWLFLGSSLAVTGCLLLFAGMAELGPMPIPARAAAGRDISAARHRAAGTSWDAVIGARREPTEPYSGQGRGPDFLPSPLPQGLPVVVLEMARTQHQEAQDTEVRASSGSRDLRSAIAEMAEAQRARRWSGSCPCPIQGGAIRCPTRDGSDDRITSAMFDPGLAQAQSRPSDRRPCPVHPVNRAEIARN